MRLLITGRYESDYNRNLVLLEGLRKRSEVELIEFPYRKRNRKAARKVKELSQQADLIFLPSFTHRDVPFIKRHTSKPIVFDPLISRYLSKVFDYQAVWKYSPRALKNYLKDYRAFHRSALILADTQQHKEYYCKNFKVPVEKIEVQPVGAVKGHFFPAQKKVKNTHFTVGFYGSFIPLHGIDHILEAARLLKEEPIDFVIYGKGILYEQMLQKAQHEKLQNVQFKGYHPYKKLNEAIQGFDLCLGIFGDSLKAQLVIPNKVYHYAACAKPILTRDTPGIRETFTHGENILLTEGNGKALAGAILKYREDDSLREHVGKNAYQLYCDQFDETHLADLFLKHLHKHFEHLKIQ